MLQQCTRKLKLAISEETETRNLREQHRFCLIEKYTAEGNTALVKPIRGIQRAEEVKRVFQRCRTARNLEHEGGLTHLLVPSQSDQDPKTCNDWRRLDCPTEIQQQLALRNQCHFGQSDGCTLTSPPTDFTMDFTATCPRTKAILNGTFLQDTSNPTTSAAPNQVASTITARTSHTPQDKTEPMDSETDTRDVSHGPLHLQ